MLSFIKGVVLETKPDSLESGDFASRSVDFSEDGNFSILRSNKVYAPIINLTDLQTMPSRQFGDIDVYLDYDRSLLYSYQYFIISRTYDRGYVHSQFGLARAEGTLPSIFAFYRGKFTPQEAIPTSGRAVYRGEMILLPELQPLSASPIASSVANGNYREDMIGKIEGSAFTGKKGGKAFDGIFTGSSAQEMTGGVFGVKRQ